MTSAHDVQDLRRPDRRTPVKVLRHKTFNFVDKIWMAYICETKQNELGVSF